MSSSYIITIGRNYSTCKFAAILYDFLGLFEVWSIIFIDIQTPFLFASYHKKIIIFSSISLTLIYSLMD